MSFSCVDCLKKPCRSHDLDQLPKGCPTAACDPEQVFAMYSDEEKEMRDIAYYLSRRDAPLFTLICDARGLSVSEKKAC